MNTGNRLTKYRMTVVTLQGYRVHLSLHYDSAKIIGNIQVPVLKMAPGAQINARIIMSRKVEDFELISESPRDSYPSLVKASK